MDEDERDFRREWDRGEEGVFDNSNTIGDTPNVSKDWVEDILDEIDKLRLERDFWRNEYIPMRAYFDNQMREKIRNSWSD